MIAPSNTYKIYLATTPVDFRKGMDGLANYVLSNFALDPLSGAFFVFRSIGRDKIKILMWDGTGLALVYKRIENALFIGSDEGAQAWAILASIVETCKLNNVNVEPYLKWVLDQIAQKKPRSEYVELLPWNAPEKFLVGSMQRMR